jgi:dTDP-glucose pyrophosphorylase
MRPLTDRWPKGLLPIDRSPVLALLLRELGAAGLDPVTIVLGHLGVQIEALVGDGSAFGLQAQYVHQPQPLGSADALRRALAAGARAPMLVSAADTAYRSGDLAAAAARFLASRASGGLGVRPVPVEELPERSWVRVEGGRVVRVIEKPVGVGLAPPAARGASPLAAAPLWLVGERLLPFFENLPGPPFELADAFQAGIDAGEPIEALELGATRDLTRPADVVTHNFPYL